MAFRLKQNESVKDGITRVVNEEVEDAFQQLRHFQSEGRDEAIHEARKDLKKIRSVLKLVRSEIGSSTYKSANGTMRVTGQALSELRDAGAIIQTFDHLLEKYHQDAVVTGLTTIRQALEEAKQKTEESLNVTKVMADSAEGLNQFRHGIQQWAVTDQGFDAIAKGLKSTYRDGRRAMKRALRTNRADDYHEWRKRAKDHWYHTRLLESVWTNAFEARERSIHEMESSLGDDHNLYVLCQQLHQDPERYGGTEAVDLFTALSRQEQRQLRKHAHAIGLRVYDEKPGAFLRSMRKLWEAWESPPETRRQKARKSGARVRV